jgi:hypothetical protein
MLGLLQKFRDEFVAAADKGIAPHTLGVTARELGGLT